MAKDNRIPATGECEKKKELDSLRAQLSHFHFIFIVLLFSLILTKSIYAGIHLNDDLLLHQQQGINQVQNFFFQQCKSSFLTTSLPISLENTSQFHTSINTLNSLIQRIFLNDEVQTNHILLTLNISLYNGNAIMEGGTPRQVYFFRSLVDNNVGVREGRLNDPSLFG